MISPEVEEAVRVDFAWLGRNSVVGDVERYLGPFVGEKVTVLAPDPRPHLDRMDNDDAHGLSADTAWKLASLVGWLFVNRPVGCPVRAGIPRVVDALRDVLADENNTWVLEQRYYEEDKPTQKAKRHAAVGEMVGGKAVVQGDWVAGRDDGTLILAPYAKVDGPESSVYVALRTAKLTRKNFERVVGIALAVSDWKTSATSMTAMFIRAEGFAALGARVAKTEVADGAYEADPQKSAAKLVAKVAGAKKIGNQAAALYLQTLALAEPTKDNILRWNGWSAKDYDAASKELVAKKLLVEASVPKAGRKVFLPGAVDKATKLNLPFETWKRPFYYADRHFKHVVGEPCHALFARAWGRVEAGDAPKK